MVISTVWYLINKDERTALYKFSQTYKYTHKPPKIIYKHNIHHTYTRTHTQRNMQERHKCLLPAWRHLCWNFALFFFLVHFEFFPVQNTCSLSDVIFPTFVEPCTSYFHETECPTKECPSFSDYFLMKEGFHTALHMKTTHKNPPHSNMYNMSSLDHKSSGYVWLRHWTWDWEHEGSNPTWGRNLSLASSQGSLSVPIQVF